ncbi:hypothetical protein GRAN_2521 [Granulicella sibirica]|uniref:Uncharacterized protein n=1 Tax=Granulicella sibirica TaxID=2479048 RepID=A0A4V1L5G3_9BACT|nr:hypothetical protein GRAN_2521 [Granulicella sibirica]
MTPLFFIGLGGSLVVVAITIVSDLHEVLSEDEAISSPEKVVSAK